MNKINWYILPAVIFAIGVAGYMVAHEIFQPAQSAMMERCNSTCAFHGVQSFSIDENGNPVCTCR